MNSAFGAVRTVGVNVFHFAKIYLYFGFKVPWTLTVLNIFFYLKDVIVNGLEMEIAMTKTIKSNAIMMVETVVVKM